jgi:hypothetical protein
VSEPAVLSVAEMLEAVAESAPELALCGAGGKKRTYTRRAEPDAQLPYVLWSGTTASADGAGYFGQPGWSGTETADCWAADVDVAKQVFRGLVQLFHDRVHPISGWLGVQSRVDYVTDVEDPSRTAWQVKARLRLRTVRLAPEE